MKKLKYFVLLCLVAIISTGCVKYNGIMEIRKDKSMDFTIIYAFDKSLMGESGSLKEESFSELKKDGYTVEKYSEGNFEGFKMIKKISNIDEVSTDSDVTFDLSGMMEENENNKYIFKRVKNGDKDTYYAKFKFDSNNSGMSTIGGEDEDEDEDDEMLPDENDTLVTTTGEDDTTTIGGSSDDSNLDLSGLTSSMDLKFTVTLPSKALSSNATTKENDDKKLTWDLKYGNAQTLEFSFEIDPNAKSDSNIILYVGIGVAALLVILVLVLLLTRKKGKPEVAHASENKVEIKNDAKEVTTSPELKEEAQVMDEAESKE